MKTKVKIQDKIAVVTGANRGIGAEICRQLGQKGILVVLTSRNEAKGMAVCQQLEKEELPVRYCPLDVEHPASIFNLENFVKKPLTTLI